MEGDELSWSGSEATMVEAVVTASPFVMVVSGGEWEWGSRLRVNGAS